MSRSKKCTAGCNYWTIISTCGKNSGKLEQMSKDIFKDQLRKQMGENEKIWSQQYVWRFDYDVCGLPGAVLP